MCGGEADAFNRVTPLLETYAARIEHMGGPGAGQYTKAANQMMVANTVVGICESLIFAHKAGLDHAKMLSLLQGGSAASANLSSLAPRMLQRDFGAGFYVEHFVKDLGIVLDESRRMGLQVPGTENAAKLYQALVEQGEQREGIQALIKALERLNDTQLPTYEKFL